MGRMRLIPSPLVPKCQGLNFLKNGGVGTVCAGSITRANLLRPGHQKKVRKKADKNWRPAKFRALYVHAKRDCDSEGEQVQDGCAGWRDVPQRGRHDWRVARQDWGGSDCKHQRGDSCENGWLRPACKAQQQRKLLPQQQRNDGWGLKKKWKKSRQKTPTRLR